MFTGTSIRELFAASVFPGLMYVLLYLVAVRYTVWRNPKAGPPGAVTPKAERLKALSGVLGLFILVMGGIHAGIFTPTEAAGIGAGGAFLMALYKRCLTIPTRIERIKRINGASMT